MIRMNMRIIYGERGCPRPEPRGNTDDHSTVEEHPLQLATSPTQRRVLARLRAMAQLTALGQIVARTIWQQSAPRDMRKRRNGDRFKQTLVECR